MRGSSILLPLTAAVVSLACHGPRQGDPRARVPIAVRGAAYDASDAAYPRETFPDGSKTANDRCMILRHKLNLKIPPIYVNGTPVGFC